MILFPVLALFVAAALPPGTVPFTIDASEDASGQFPGAPRIQSFSFAQWKGRWVFIGGRMAGYHSVGGGMAEFLRADANREVWVVDTTVKPARTYHASLDTLPVALAPVKDQWASTAQLYFQDGANLYIGGGYGQDASGKWTTFPIISQVHLPQLIDGVMQGRLPPASIAYAPSPLVQSSGGELIKLPDGYFYLVMGHTFQGSYTTFEGQAEHNSQSASQEYLNEIRKLKIAPGAPGQLLVTLAGRFREPSEFHRRDLNVAHFLSPQGLGLAAYGGVFKPETQLGYSKPIYLAANSKPKVDSAFDQKMNLYSCAKLLMYDSQAETMYTTFFGGISRFTWDSTAEKFAENPMTGSKTAPVYLDGLQWSDQISTVLKVMAAGQEATTEMVHPKPLPGFLGTNAVFIPAPELARAHPDTDILDFQMLKGTRTFAGYLYGGIRAAPYKFPYLKTGVPYNAGTVPTKPSDLVLKVFVEAPGPRTTP
jgi:hypothetical protein